MMCVIIGSPPPTVTFRDSYLTLSSSSSHTFGPFATGDASGTRNVFCAIGLAGSVTGVSIGGFAATLDVSVGSGLLATRLYRAIVPTGTTASVVITQSSSSGQTACIWTAENLTNTTPFATSSASAASFASSRTLTANINTPDNGIVIGYSKVLGNDFASNPTLTWTGMTEFGRKSTSSEIFAGASNVVATAQTPRSVSSSYTTAVSGASCAVIAASYR